MRGLSTSFIRRGGAAESLSSKASRHVARGRILVSGENILRQSKWKEKALS